MKSNVQYRLCLAKWKMGGFLIKKPFILGMKLNVIKNLLLKVERVVQFPCEHPFFFVANKLRAS